VNVRRRTAQRLANARQSEGWYRIVRNDAGGPTRVDVYDDIGGGGWFDDGVTAAGFVAELAQISGDIEVHINSPGGDVFDGIAIYNAIAGRAGNVTTVVDGLAASIASVIAQAGQTRIIAPGAMMMIHDGLALCIGNAADMRATAGLLDTVSDNIASIYAAKGGTPAGWRAAMQNETWYTAQSAVDAGLADKLAERPSAPDSMAAAARWAEQMLPAGRPALGLESMPLLAAKAIAVHHTDTAGGAWDGPAAVAAMPAEYADLHYCHAWQSAEADSSPHKAGDDDADDKKANFRFPHHRARGGPAIEAACSNGVARLDGSAIPDGDKPGVKAHLQAHLDDARKSEASGRADGAGFTVAPAQILKALEEAFK
jgi:ATP-dependent protease ClpP protease subunit